MKKRSIKIVRETFENPLIKRDLLILLLIFNLKAEQIEHKHPYSGKIIPDPYANI